MKTSVPLACFASLSLAACSIIPHSEHAPFPPPPPVQSRAPSAVLHPVPIPPSSPASAQLVHAALGQTIAIGDLRVTPLKVLEDSRCPINARCVWAGQVRLRIRARLISGMRTVEIASGKPLRIADGILELHEIAPDKVTGRNKGAVPLSAYRFGFGFMSVR